MIDCNTLLIVMLAFLVTGNAKSIIGFGILVMTRSILTIALHLLLRPLW